jgi:hypothetical protein
MLTGRTASAAPIIGGQLYSTGGDIIVEVLPATAGFVSELHLYSPGPDRFIALNTDVGTVINLGSYPAGSELIFGIFVRNTGNTFLMGPGIRNPDGIPHVGVDVQGPGLAIVGFEDLLGGGDLDYDDNVFRFTGGIAPLGCPADIVMGTDPGECGAVVSYSVTPPDGAIVVCVPPSGVPYPVGDTLVTCTATYLDLRTATCSFTITVVDDEAPALTCPADITQANDPGQCAARVTWTIERTDNCPGVTLACNPMRNSDFPLGTTVVNCVATDAAGNQARCSFNVTVEDREAPAITCPSDIVQANDPGLCSAVVRYEVTATDNCPGVTVECSPASGSTFDKGATTVECVATDGAGIRSRCSFTVTVEDREAPVVTCSPGVNPSGKQIPTAGKNPASGQNPDGFYRLLGRDNCDAAPKLYIKDSASAFVAGPFASGDTVKITQAPGVTPGRKPGAGVVVAHIHLKGDALLYATDADGNVSAAISCRVPPRSK